MPAVVALRRIVFHAHFPVLVRCWNSATGNQVPGIKSTGAVTRRADDRFFAGVFRAVCRDFDSDLEAIVPLLSAASCRIDIMLIWASSARW